MKKQREEKMDLEAQENKWYSNIKIEDVVPNYEIAFMGRSVKASKYPMAVDTDKCTEDIVARTMKLAKCPKGEAHDHFLNGIKVGFDLVFSIKAWAEAERYHWFDFTSSQSTMHKLKDMKIAECCVEYTDPRIIEIAQELVDTYNENPTRDNYLDMVYSVPVGLKLVAGMTTNYLQLKTMYAQRRNHRLPEWQVFCDWIETLPNSTFITGED